MPYDLFVREEGVILTTRVVGMNKSTHIELLKRAIKTLTSVCFKYMSALFEWNTNSPIKYPKDAFDLERHGFVKSSKAAKAIESRSFPCLNVQRF